MSKYNYTKRNEVRNQAKLVKANLKDKLELVEVDGYDGYFNVVVDGVEIGCIMNGKTDGGASFWRIKYENEVSVKYWSKWVAIAALLDDTEEETEEDSKPYVGTAFNSKGEKVKVTVPVDDIPAEVAIVETALNDFGESDSYDDLDGFMS